MLVLKLGGSLARGAALRPWLEYAAQQAAVVVPGGGAFADTVRAQQGVLAIDDAAAHDMALMAMTQLARACAAVAPGLAYAETEAAARACAAAGRGAVFAAWPALRGAPDLPVGWDVTSDSIAAWLAIRLGAARLLLVKSVPPADADPAALARAGVVDARLPALLRGYAGEAWISGPVPDGARLRLRAPAPEPVAA